MTNREFQAIVLAAGRGSRLPEVASQSPKCLLPVGPYPLLWYPLNMLQQHNFQEAIVIVLDSQRVEIQQSLEKTGISNKLKLEFATIPSDEDFGTADSLRHIHDKIKTDFIVVPCDVVTNVSLYPVINKFRQHDAAMSTLLFPSKFDTGVTVPGPKSKQKPERDLIGIHTESRRLLFLASTSDFEDIMSVNGHLLRKYGKMTIFSRLIDSHIYIMKKWVIDLLKKKENMSTLKGEFLPYLIKKQMAKYTGSPLEIPKGSIVNSKLGDEVFEFVKVTQNQKQILDSSFFNDSRLKEPYNTDVIRCYAVEAPKDCVGLRINTTLSYFAINSKINSIWSQLFNGNAPPLISSTAIVNSTQTKDIAVLDNAKLSEKTSLNSSVFGTHCIVNPKNIISNSIIMGHAVIEESCKIENCIIGYRAVVRKGSVLKNCLIGPSYDVDESSDIQNVYLTNADGFMEIE